jgi:hypothetical protein
MWAHPPSVVHRAQLDGLIIPGGRQIASFWCESNTHNHRGQWFGDGPILFSRHGRGIVYPVREGQTDNLWRQNLDGSPGKQLTEFKSELIRDYDYSFDGKQLAIIRGHRESDIVLIREGEK